MEGIFGILKPVGMTSHDVIHKLRLKTGVQRIGHAGTLDPLASGVLVVAVGRKYTKQIGSIVQKDKEYRVTATLGEYSATDDAEGEKTKVYVAVTPTKESVLSHISNFKGNILLRPPAYSAIKVRGKRAYALARKGKPVDLEKRPALIKEIECLLYSWPSVTLRIVTGPGVYVRSIIRELGDVLKCGAFVSQLERTRVGDFTKDKCLTLAEIVT